MPKFFLFILGTLILFHPMPAQRVDNGEIHRMIMEGISFNRHQQYNEAKICFLTLINQYPAHPSGYLYLAATIHTEYSDYEDRFDNALFDSLLRRAANLADRMAEQRGEKARGYFYAGTASAYAAFSESEEGRWFKALSEGIQSSINFEECLAADPNYYDAMSGLGTYYYWKSKKTEYVSWLPFLGDKRERGIQMVRSTIEKGTYENAVAQNSLIWILIEEKRYGDAARLSEQILLQYPGNRAVLWGLLTAYERKNDVLATRKTVELLLSSILSAPVRNFYSEATCRLKLALYAFEEKNYDASMEECKKILQYQHLRGKTRRDIGKKLDSAAEMQKKIYSRR